MIVQNSFEGEFSWVVKFQIDLRYNNLTIFQIKGKSLFIRKGIPKIKECHAISFITIVCWHQMAENNFKRYFLIYLRPLSSVPISKVGPYLGPIVEKHQQEQVRPVHSCCTMVVFTDFL